MNGTIVMRSTPFLFAAMALFFGFSVRCKLTCNDCSNAQNHIYPFRTFRFRYVPCFGVVSIALALSFPIELFSRHEWHSLFWWNAPSSSESNAVKLRDRVMSLRWCATCTDKKLFLWRKKNPLYIFTLCISRMMRRSLRFKCKSFSRMKNSSHDACLLIKLLPK